MKISIVKVPSRYERIVVDGHLEQLKEFLERRLIKSQIEEDDISRKLEIYENTEDHPITVRPGYIIYIYNEHIVSVDIPEFNEFDKFFKKLSKIKNKD